ncbi:MAG: hypothetical protein ACPIOQ_05180 [Promethearchaeia archaeon]
MRPCATGKPTGAHEEPATAGRMAELLRGLDAFGKETRCPPPA